MTVLLSGLVTSTVARAAPADPLAAHQWALAKVRAPDVWATSTGAGINVAIVDSGVDLHHADLSCSGKLLVVPGSDVVLDGSGPDDVRGSGTHSAGIVGACANNGVGIAGIAPGAAIMPIQVMRSSGAATFSDVATGVRRAADAGAHVIDVSVTPSVGVLSYVPDLFAELEDAVRYAASKGAVVVAPAGNDSMPLCESPALATEVVCVGATDARDLKAWYSTFPAKPGANELTVSAPGGTEHVLCGNYAESVLSLFPAELDDCEDGLVGYADRNGTNVAAAHVAGLAALAYQQAGPRSTSARDRVVQRLLWTADDLGVPGQDPLFGFGRVNAVRAIALEQAPISIQVEAAAVAAALTTELRCVVRVEGGAAIWTEVTDCYTSMFTASVSTGTVRQGGNVATASKTYDQLTGGGTGLVCWKAATMLTAGRLETLTGCGTTRPLSLEVAAESAVTFYAVAFSCTATARGNVAWTTRVDDCWTYDWDDKEHHAPDFEANGNVAVTASAFPELGPRLRPVCWEASTIFVDGIRLSSTGCE